MHNGEHMKIANKSHIEVEKDGKLVSLIVDADLSLGLIFDAVMEIKGMLIEKMSVSHKSEQAEADEHMGAPEKAAAEVPEATEEPQE